MTVTAPRTESAQILSYLFSVVIALSLVTAVQFLVASTDNTMGFFGVRTEALLIFVAFMVTIVPFYHGGALALARITIQRKSRLLNLSNFAMLLMESMIFYAMAASLSSVRGFVVWLALLMGLDALWIVFVHAAGGSDAEAPKAWGLVNFFMFIALVVLWNFGFETTGRYALLCGAALARTALDYCLTFKYYLE